MNEYEEQIEMVKRYFNFHPEHKFESISDVLEQGKKVSGRYYGDAAAGISDNLARYIDKQNQS